MAFFSIVVPVYNVELYLDRCLKSVIGQTFSDFELILVDDGSTDSSSKICDKYSITLTNCKVVHQVNKGLSGARNTGLKESTGKFVYFLDSDDVIDHELLETLFKTIKKNQDVDVIGFDALIIQEGISEKKLTTSNGINGIQFGLNFSEKKVPRSTVPLYCYRRDFLNNCGLKFFEGIFYEDLLFTAQVFLKNPKVYMLGESFYLYYKRQGSITTSYIRKKYYEDMLTINRILLGENKLCKNKQQYAFRNIYKSYLLLSEEVYSMLSREDRHFEMNKRKLFFKENKMNREIIGTTNLFIAMFPKVFFFVRNILRILMRK